jgi:hypothetical protein
MEQSIQRRATGWTAGVPFPAGARDFSLLHNVQTDCGGPPIVLYNVGSLSPGIKWPGREAAQSSVLSADVSGGAVPPLPHTF